jgi:hypothetical protein
LALSLSCSALIHQETKVCTSSKGNRSMLSINDIGYLNTFAYAYDHNWPLYQMVLGEPFLCADCLAYNDGSGLYICAFPLQRPYSELRSATLVALISDICNAGSSHPPKFINLWGRLEALPETLRVRDAAYTLLRNDAYDPDATELTICLDEFSDSNPGVAKRMRAVRRSALQVTVANGSLFGHEHQFVMEKWLQAHCLSPVHLEFILAIPSYVRDSRCILIEARIGSSMVGFSVLSELTPNRIVLTNSFPLRSPGLRVGDALTIAAIDYAKERGYYWLNRGYSANSTIKKNKLAWGSVVESPPYREVFYVSDGSWDPLILSGNFLWASRSGFRHSMNNVAAHEQTSDRNS